MRGSTGRLVLVGTLLVAGVLVWLLAGGSGGGPGVPASTSSASVAVDARTAPASAGPGARTSAAARTAPGVPRRTTTQPPGGPTATDLRSKALFVLATVDATGRPPSGYQGGRQFLNDGRGGTAALPRRTPDGRTIGYHEYDVNPYTPGVNRGPQRLVVGDDRSAYLTGDHYVTWQRLR